MTDAHCHPWDLLEFLENPEGVRRETKTACVANSWNREQFDFHEDLAKKALEDRAPRIICPFALHPQLSAAYAKGHSKNPDFQTDDVPSLSSGLELLFSLGGQGRLNAVGETGFDLYDETFKAGEKIQDEMFICHLETALKQGLPLILHVRRAMHKIFPFTRELKKLPAVIFHSWPGTLSDGEALLRRGINTFFSLNAIVLLNHRKAMTCAALFPPERILLETDAPFQPLRGNSFSSWRDLGQICGGIASLRKEAGSLCNTPEEVEEQTTANFYGIFAFQSTTPPQGAGY